VETYVTCIRQAPVEANFFSSAIPGSTLRLATAASLRRCRSAYRLGYGLDDRGSIPGRGNDGIYFSSPPSFRPALGLTHSPIQWVPGIKRPGREADHSPLSSVEIRNVLRYTSTPPIRLHDVVLN
jgi:hypothetical protein